MTYPDVLTCVIAGGCALSRVHHCPHNSTGECTCIESNGCRHFGSDTHGALNLLKNTSQIQII